MSGTFKRVTLTLQESADEPLEGTSIVFRQRVGGVMLLAAFLALACLPAHRAFMADQATRALTGRVPDWMRAANGGMAGTNQRLISEARKAPDVRDLQLGAVSMVAPAVSTAGNAVLMSGAGFSDSRVLAADAVRKQFPNDPVPAAHVLRLCWTATGGLKRTGSEKQTPGARLSTRDLETMEQLCREGMRLEPGNGFFPSLLATVQFAGMQDDAALESLHAASVCDSWSDYAFVQGVGARDLLIRTYGDRGLVMHALPLAAVLLPHFLPIRQAAAMAAERATSVGASGDREREHRIRTDVIRLGSLMRRNADTLIGRLVGATIEDLGMGAELHHVGLPETDRQAHASSQRKAYAARVRKEAPAFAAEVERELGHFEKFLELKKRYLDGSSPFKIWDQVIQKDISRDSLGLTLLRNLAACLGLWILTAGVMAVARRGNTGKWLGTWSPGSLAAVLGAGAAAGVVSALTAPISNYWTPMLPAYWLMGGQNSSLAVSVPVQLLCSGALVSLLIPGVVLLLGTVRRRPGLGILDGIRLAFKTAATLAAVLYLGYVLTAVPASHLDAQRWEESIALEMQGVPI